MYLQLWEDDFGKKHFRGYNLIPVKIGRLGSQEAPQGV